MRRLVRLTVIAIVMAATGMPVASMAADDAVAHPASPQQVPRMTDPSPQGQLGRPGRVTALPAWAGWDAVPNPGTANGFTFVQATFTVPMLNCATYPTSVGAAQGVSLDLTGQLAGVEGICNHAIPSYAAGFVMNNVGFTFQFAVKPGDVITASDTYDGHVEYTQAVKDNTSGQSFVTPPTLCTTGCTSSSAAVMTQAIRAPAVNLADFGSVLFSKIKIIDFGGMIGGLRDANWAAAQSQMIVPPHHVLVKPTLISPGGTFINKWIS